MPRRWFAALLMTTALAGGCAGGSGTAVRHEGRAAGQEHKLPLKGVYRATIIPPFDFIGPIAGRISAEPTDKGFIASTRPGIAWDMIGGLQGMLGSFFVPFIFPGGTIGTWTSTLPDGDKPGEGWFGVGGIKSAGVATRITSADDPVELQTARRKVGLLVIEPDSPDAGPIRDYPAIAEDLIAAIQSRLYDPALTRSLSIRAYANQVRFNSKLARDDVEFIFGTVAAARNHIKFTMPLAFPKGDPASRAAMAAWSPAELTTIRTSFNPHTKIATIKADAFLAAPDVDRVFTEVLSHNPKALILDLRSTPGVTLASLRILSWLCEDTVDAGIFFGPTRRADMLSASPTPAHEVTLASAAGVEEIEAALDEHGAVRVLVKPEPNRFTGPVAVLTSRRTSASAEPLVLALKSSGRAEVFGQPTAGKPFLSRPIDLRDKWVLWLAAADFKPTSGERIPPTGIKPDIETQSRDSAGRAAEKRLLELTGGPPPPKTSDLSTGSLLAPFFKAAGHGDKK